MKGYFQRLSHCRFHCLVAWIGFCYGLFPFLLHANTVVTLGPGIQATQISPVNTDAAVPYNYKWASRHMQFIYRASELQQAGAVLGNFYGLAWYVMDQIGGSLKNYTIKLKNTASTDVSVYDGNNLITVKSPAFLNPAIDTGWLSIPFDVPFVWDGTSNILVDVCFGTNNSSSNSGSVRLYDQQANQRIGINDATNGLCTQPTTTPDAFKPCVRFFPCRPTPPTLLTDTFCLGRTYSFGGNLLYRDGVYYDTLTNVQGCDSVVVLQLYSRPQSYWMEVRYVCPGDSTFYYGRYFTEGDYLLDTLPSSLGCDSIVMLHVYPNQTEFNNPQTICNGEAYFINGHAYTIFGTFRDTLQSAQGCDSIMVTQLSIRYPSQRNVTLDRCDGDSLFFGGQWLRADGVFRDTLMNAAGCDSVVIVQLNFHPPFYAYQSDTICSGDSIWFAGSFRKQSGVYRDQHQTRWGCDSVLELRLWVRPEVIDTFRNRLCPGTIFNWQGQGYTQTGIYRDTFQSVWGCDAVWILILDSGFVTTHAYIDSFCSGASYWFNNTWRNTPGVYQDTLMNRWGCDSILILTLLESDTFNLQIDTVLASGSSLELPWGETVFVPGTYRNNTAGPDECNHFITVHVSPVSGIPDYEALVHWFPNPVQNDLWVNFRVELPITFELMGMDGKSWRVPTEKVKPGGFAFSIGHLPPGNYVLKCKSDKWVQTLRFVKQSTD